MPLNFKQIKSIFESIEEDKHKHVKISIPDRRNINKELDKISKNYYKKVPIDDIVKILSKVGIVLLQEDGTKWTGFLLGANGRATIEIGHKKNIDGRSFIPYNNTMLVISWYSMPSGLYEVTVYLS